MSLWAGCAYDLADRGTRGPTRRHPSASTIAIIASASAVLCMVAILALNQYSHELVRALFIG